MNLPTQTSNGEGGLAPIPDQIRLSGEQDWPITTHEFAQWRGRVLQLTFTAYDWKARDLELRVDVWSSADSTVDPSFTARIDTDEDLIVAAWCYLNPKREGRYADIEYADGDFEALLAARMQAQMPDEPRLTDEDWEDQ